jgi:hypothetical protein
MFQRSGQERGLQDHYVKQAGRVRRLTHFARVLCSCVSRRSSSVEDLLALVSGALQDLEVALRLSAQAADKAEARLQATAPSTLVWPNSYGGNTFFHTSANSKDLYSIPLRTRRDGKIYRRIGVVHGRGVDCNVRSTTVFPYAHRTILCDVALVRVVPEDAAAFRADMHSFVYAVQSHRRFCREGQLDSHLRRPINRNCIFYSVRGEAVGPRSPLTF